MNENSSYGPIAYNGYIAPCQYCGSPGVIIGWSDGIGDVCCSNSECMAHGNGVHYSGKFRTRKRDAIRKWNVMQSIKYTEDFIPLKDCT